MIPLRFTFLFFTVFTSAIAQVKTGLQKENVVEPKTIPAGQPKLIANHGAKQYPKTADDVHCALQDKAGNLWFGTTGDGVYRFDGKSFVNFTIKDGLNDNCVFCVLEDRSGNIWFGTKAGLCCYNGTTIITVPIITTNSTGLSADISSGNKEITKNTVSSMLQDKSGIIWFGTATGVYCYNGKSFTHFLENDGVINKNQLSLKAVGCMLEDKNGSIWFGSGMGGGEGVCRYDIHLNDSVGQKKSITNFKPNGDVWICNMMEDKAGNIWVSGRNHGYFRYDGKTFTDFTEKVRFSAVLEDKAVNNCFTGKVGFGPVLQDKAGNIWFTGKMVRFGGDGGIWRYADKSCTNFSIKDGMGDYAIWCMIEDKARNIWVGTRNTGLYRFDGKTFTCFSE